MKSVTGSGNSKCKGPEMGNYLVCLRDRKRTSVSEA